MEVDRPQVTEQSEPGLPAADPSLVEDPQVTEAAGETVPCWWLLAQELVAAEQHPGGPAALAEGSAPWIASWSGSAW